MTTDLTMTSLAENEQIIARGMDTFMKVGIALANIRDDQQYAEAGYETFADYVVGRWGFQTTWAYQQIGAARVSAIADTAGLPQPPNELVARQLVKVYNTAAGVGRGESEVVDPEAGERAVIDVYRKAIAKAAEQTPEEAAATDGEPTPQPKPVTGAIVAAVARAATDGATSTSSTPNTAELLGRVGDLVNSATKAMDRVDKARKPGERVRALAREYAEAAGKLAARLSAYGSGSGGGE